MIVEKFLEALCRGIVYGLTVYIVQMAALVLWAVWMDHRLRRGK